MSAGCSSQGCPHPTQQGGWAVLLDQHLDYAGGHLGSSGHGVEGEAPAGQFCTAGCRHRTPLAGSPVLLYMQVLVNGPGTCIPVCVAAFLFR